jgi:hypothetical protein
MRKQKERADYDAMNSEEVRANTRCNAEPAGVINTVDRDRPDTRPVGTTGENGLPADQIPETSGSTSSDTQELMHGDTVADPRPVASQHIEAKRSDVEGTAGDEVSSSKESRGSVEDSVDISNPREDQPYPPRLATEGGQSAEELKVLSACDGIGTPENESETILTRQGEEQQKISKEVPGKLESLMIIAKKLLVSV